MPTPNPEPDHWSGSAPTPNPERNHGPVREGSGPNQSSEPNHGNPNARLHPGCTVHSNYLTPRLDTNKGDRDTGQQSLPDLIPQLPV